jgi:RNA polymerase sigma-70 factor, ECF subfamily
VLQTVYLKVLMGKARYNGKSSFKTWLFAVIRRTAADERRRQLLRRLSLDRRQVRPALASAERPVRLCHLPRDSKSSAKNR